MNWYLAYIDVSEDISAIASQLFGFLTGSFVTVYKGFFVINVSILVYFHNNYIEIHCLYNIGATAGKRNRHESIVECLVSRRYGYRRFQYCCMGLRHACKTVCPEKANSTTSCLFLFNDLGAIQSFRHLSLQRSSSPYILSTTLM